MPPPRSAVAFTSWSLVLITAGHALGASKRPFFTHLGLNAPLSGLVLTLATLLWLSVCCLALKRHAESSPHLRDGKSRVAVLLACAGCVAMQALSSLGAEAPLMAWQYTSLTALGLGMVLLMWYPLRDALRPLALSLSHVPRAVLCVHAVLLLGGVLLFLVAGRQSWPFATAPHQHTGGIPRFYGFGVNPFYAAITFVTCAGLISERDFQRWGRTLLSVLLVSTLSFVTLLVPLLWLDVISLRPSLRRLLKLAVVLAALCTLYVHPLQLAWGPHNLRVGTLHESYARAEASGLSMPIGSQRLLPGGPSLTAHATAYFYLSERALRCFGEHPWLGVGPGNFAMQCPIRIMDTYGKWRNHTPAHNQYLGTLAEEGLLGVLAWAFLAVVLVRRITVSPRQRSLLTLYLLAGVACPIFEQVPFWVWMGVLLGNAERDGNALHGTAAP